MYIFALCLIIYIYTFYIFILSSTFLCQGGKARDQSRSPQGKVSDLSALGFQGLVRPLLICLGLSFIKVFSCLSFVNIHIRSFFGHPVQDQKQRTDPEGPLRVGRTIIIHPC